MRSPYCVFRNRFIALSICLGALLAFSTTLSADTYTFVPGVGVSGLSYLGVSGIGPYGGTLTDTTTGKVSPNSIFFCLTGNQSYISSGETGVVGPPSLLESLVTGAPTVVQQEEAAFLASYLMVTKEAMYGITLSTTGTGNNKQLVVSGSDVADFEAALGPIQLAIWYVMKTLPSAFSGWSYADVNTISDPNTKTDVLAAQAGYAGDTWANNNLQVFLTSNQTSGGQNFISTAVPEPGTMVLFGAGALLMALGCARRRLARRPR